MNRFKQATIAYKTDGKGNAVDVNWQLISVSGRRQAIALLEGRANPDPNKYEVELYFRPRGEIDGAPSVTFDAKSCPFGFIKVSPASVILTAEQTTATLTLESSTAWKVLNKPSFLEVDITEGGAGLYEIHVSASNKGQGEIVFISESTGLTAKTWVTRIDVTKWVLTGGVWDNFGLWYDAEKWEFKQ